MPEDGFATEERVRNSIAEIRDGARNWYDHIFQELLFPAHPKPEIVEMLVDDYQRLLDLLDETQQRILSLFPRTDAAIPLRRIA